MISMKDIADICGVSEATVSKALRGKGGVGQKKCEHIKAVASKYNYAPNALVQGIQQGFTRTIGIISGNEYEDAFAGQIMRGIDKAIIAEDFRAMLVHMNGNTGEERDLKLIKNFAERRVDGLLIVGKNLSNPMLFQDLLNFSRPIVLVDQPAPGDAFDFIGSDNIAGAKIAVEHLVSLGHKDIAFCGVLSADTGQKRLEGFREAMNDNQITVREDWICDSSDISAYDIVTALLVQEKRPSAVMCFNDLCAIDVISAAYDLGLKVPEQLSVTGFANLPVSNRIRPSITTIGQDAEAMGETGTRLLLDLISKNRAGKKTDSEPRIPKKIIMDTELIIRDSTGVYKPE